MKYRVIGDIHGRDNWHKLIKPFNKNTMYIFVGDYTDPYYGEERDVTYEKMVEEIKFMLKFKKKHKDNVILLLGNHDMQYIIKESETYRFDKKHCQELFKLFEDNKDLFHGVAYNIGNKYMITHSGIANKWFHNNIGQYFGEYTKDAYTLDKISNHINKLWENNVETFTFDKNVTHIYDSDGSSESHSPVWIRPYALWDHNLFGFNGDVVQVIGHTRYVPLFKKEIDLMGRITTFCTHKCVIPEEDIKRNGLDFYIHDEEGNGCALTINKENEDIVNLILVDCLSTETACIEIDDETMTWKKIIKE